MDDLFAVNADTMFSTLANQGAGLESLSNQALTSGIDKYMDKDYEGAAIEFKRAVGLAPYSSYSLDAYKYMSKSYQKMGDTDKAIDAYRQAIKLHPDYDELQVELGNLLYGEGRYEDAEAAYREAVRIYPDANNRYSLGQALLAGKKYVEAEDQFKQVKALTPNSPNGDFGLGLAYSAQKMTDKAVSHFQSAINIQDDFYDAYVEMGYAYADAGQMDKAGQVKDLLEDGSPALADLLDRYMYNAEPPRILFAWATSTFRYELPPKTEASALDSYLANANASKEMNMIFQFDKDMDRESVENPLNWSIARAVGAGPAQSYNYGMGIPDTELHMVAHPASITYDETHKTATLRFSVTQNAAGDGTIDPSHIQFTFSGTDSDGNRIDAAHDQFSGFSGVV